MAPTVADKTSPDAGTEYAAKQHVPNEVSIGQRLIRDILMFRGHVLSTAYLSETYAAAETEKLVKRRIDWSHFLVVFESVSEKQQTMLAEELQPEYSAYLLHYVCMSGAPGDVIERVLRASIKPLSHKCDLMEATPLHLACFFGRQASAVRVLLDGDVDNVALFSRDVLGRLPLHVVCERGGNTSSTAIVKMLLQRDDLKRTIAMTDRKGETPMQKASQLASEDVIAKLLEGCLEADHMESNAFTMDDLPSQLPLHKAFHQRTASPGNVVKLLTTGPSVVNLKTKDRRGQLPIHLACQHGVGSAAFKQLILNDRYGETFQCVDSSGMTPTDILLGRILDEDESVIITLKELASADEARRFFSTEDSKGRSMLDNLLVSFPATVDVLLPVWREALRLLDACTPPGVGSYMASMEKSRKILGDSLFDRLYDDRKFHNTLNTMMQERSFTFLFMMDLYLRIFLVAGFTISTNNALHGELDAHGAFAVTYICAFLLLLWQFRLIWSHQLYYLNDAWNVMSLISLICLSFSVGLLHAGKQNEGPFRSFNVMTGGLVWFFIITAALRSTFLPFSVFVSGFTMIGIYMIPFGTTTFLMMGAFAEMYFKLTEGSDSCDATDPAQDFCHYDSSLLKVYAMFVGGIDGSLLTPDTGAPLLILSIFYAFIFSIIMLNVLVAVIFDAWGRVSPRGRMFYWRFRHDFLVETSSSKGALRNLPNLIRFEFLSKLDAHTQSYVEAFLSRPERASQAVSIPESICESLMFVLEGVYLLLWFLAGLLTASLLWPNSFRHYIFSIAEEETSQDDSGMTRGRVDDASDTTFLNDLMPGESSGLRDEIERLKDVIEDLRSALT